MTDEWGSVDGDVNAQAIIADRRSGKKAGNWASIVVGAAFVVCAVWYGATGAPAALAFFIITAVWAINGQASRDLYGTHTFVMIAERRAQLLEQQVQGLRDDVSELRRLLERDRASSRRDYD